MSEPYRLHTSRAEHRLLLRPDSADLRLSDHAYRLGLIDEDRYMQVVQKRVAIEQALGRLDELSFTSSRLIENCAREVGIAPLGQLLTGRELLRRPEVHYQQVANLAQRVEQERATLSAYTMDEGILDEGSDVTSAAPLLPALEQEAAEEVDLQVKYESYIRKQEQMVHRTRRLEEMRIPETLDYALVSHLRTEARQKLTRTLPRTVGQASRVEGVTPADIAILMIYVEKLRALKASS